MSLDGDVGDLDSSSLVVSSSVRQIDDPGEPLWIVTSTNVPSFSDLKEDYMNDSLTKVAKSFPQLPLDFGLDIEDLNNSFDNILVNLDDLSESFWLFHQFEHSHGDREDCVPQLFGKKIR